MEIKKVHFKSDFKVILASETGWTVPFRLKFYTNAPSRPFVATFDGTTYNNCHLENDGRLCVAFDNHKLGLGSLMLEPTFYIDDACYQDGICDEVIPAFKVTVKDTSNVEYEIKLTLDGVKTLETVGTLPAYYMKGPKGDKGDPGALDPTQVAAINAAIAAKANKTELGTLSSLTTTDKSSAVAAINEVAGNVGDFQTELAGKQDKLDYYSEGSGSAKIKLSSGTTEWSTSHSANHQSAALIITQGVQGHSEYGNNVTISPYNNYMNFRQGLSIVTNEGKKVTINNKEVSTTDKLDDYVLKANRPAKVIPDASSVILCTEQNVAVDQLSISAATNSKAGCMTAAQKQQLDAATDGIGTLSALTTEAKTSAVAAINEVDGKVGEISSEITTLSAAAVKVTEQTLTDSQKAQARANIGAAAEGGGGTFSYRAMIEATGATYNGQTGFYEIGGLTDLTESDMLKCVNYVGAMAIASWNGLGFRSMKGARVLYYLDSASSISLNGGFRSLTDLESVVVKTFQASNFNNAFNQCQKLKYIGYGSYINVSTITAYTATFSGCAALKYVHLYKLNAAISFSNSPDIEAESVAYMINNAGTATFTITMHATAYARAMADADVQAALAAKTNVSLASA